MSCVKPVEKTPKSMVIVLELESECPLREVTKDISQLVGYDYTVRQVTGMVIDQTKRRPPAPVKKPKPLRRT